MLIPYRWFQLLKTLKEERGLYVQRKKNAQKNNFLSFLPRVLDLISTKLWWYGGNTHKKKFLKNIIPGQRIKAKKIPGSFFFFLNIFLIFVWKEREQAFVTCGFSGTLKSRKNTGINFSINFCHPVNKIKLTFLRTFFFLLLLLWGWHVKGRRKNIN